MRDTALLVFGAGVVLIGVAVVSYFLGREHESEWVRDEAKKLEQERDAALFARDVAMVLANEKIQQNAKLRQSLLTKHLTMTREPSRN